VVDFEFRIKSVKDFMPSIPSSTSCSTLVSDACHIYLSWLTGLIISPLR